MGGILKKYGVMRLMKDILDDPFLNV